MDASPSMMASARARSRELVPRRRACRDAPSRARGSARSRVVLQRSASIARVSAASAHVVRVGPTPRRGRARRSRASDLRGETRPAGVDALVELRTLAGPRRIESTPAAPRATRTTARQSSCPRPCDGGERSTRSNIARSSSGAGRGVLVEARALRGGPSRGACPRAARPRAGCRPSCGPGSGARTRTTRSSSSRKRTL